MNRPRTTKEVLAEYMEQSRRLQKKLFTYMWISAVLSISIFTMAAINILTRTGIDKWAMAILGVSWTLSAGVGWAFRLQQSRIRHLQLMFEALEKVDTKEQAMHLLRHAFSKTPVEVKR